MSVTAANPTPSSTSQPLVGWVLESPGRGTLGLVLSCLTTLFLCTWVVIHARVCNSPFLQGLHKAVLLLKTIIAPEFIAVEGLQEWSQARKIVKDCSSLTGGCLKLVHAFYIGMLALRYRTAEGSKVLWPNQFVWLLEQRLITWDDHASWGLSEETIRDKSNADGATKLIALGQILWFVAQSIMRTVHNLPLAQLETMTLSYIPLFALTYCFWWIKPKDVRTPSVVDLPFMTSDQKAIFEALAVSCAFDDDNAGKPDSLEIIFALTPRVFERVAEQRKVQVGFRDSSRRAHHTHLDKTSSDGSSPIKDEIAPGPESITKNPQKAYSADPSEPCKAPAKEIVVAYWDPEVYHSKRLWPIVCLFGASFGALHLLSWNAVFPTLVEQWLWRVAALVSIFSMLVFMQFEKVVVRWGGPLTLISLFSPFLYLLSRLAMIGGVIAAFRAADPAIYDTYPVSTYWVHIL